jgi:hypothetical protein
MSHPWLISATRAQKPSILNRLDLAAKADSTGADACIEVIMSQTQCFSDATLRSKEESPEDYLLAN